MEENEIWKPIPGYEASYAVSNFGRVKSIARVVGRRYLREKVLSITVNGRGVLRASVSQNGRKDTFEVHRVVAQIFVPNPNNFEYVDFRNGDPSNLLASNLVWVEYMSHKRVKVAREKIFITKSKSSGPKLTQDDVRQVRKLKSAGMKSVEIARRFGVSTSLVSAILTGKAWSHV